MAVTKSWEQVSTSSLGTFTVPVPTERRRELWWLLGSSLLVAASLLMVCLAKTQNFAELQAKLDHGELLNLNTVTSEEQLQPFVLGNTEAARQTLGLSSNSRAGQRGTDRPARFSRPSNPLNEGQTALRRPHAERVLSQVRHLGRHLFHRFLSGSHCLALAAFPWRPRNSSRAPAPHRHRLHARCQPERSPAGYARIRKVRLGRSLRLRPSAAPALASLPRSRFSNWIYTPLLAAFALFVLLMRFGRAPPAATRRVNLGPFQPVEVIKILLVLFMAGYFARNWERLRDLRMKKLLLGLAQLPRLEHVCPVVFAVGIALLLVLRAERSGPGAGDRSSSFYHVRRGARTLPAWRSSALALLIAGVTVGYRMGQPADRGRAHRHVALALGQRRSRRRSTGALPVGVVDRRLVGIGSRLGRSRHDSRRQHRPGAAGDRRRMGLRRRGHDACCLCSWCIAHFESRPTRGNEYALLPGAWPWHR